ncbi:MAG: DUF4837 family protein [Chitinophagales bacterium]|nr:DUF4837 family protein [Chitinophagales bacterium]
MKNYIAIILSLTFILFSCKKKEHNSPAKFGTVLPSSTGGADEVMIILPDNIMDSTMQYFMGHTINESYKILPSPEAIFKISQVQYSIMNNLMYRYRNIILVADVSQKSEILGVAKQVLPANDFKALEEGKQYFFHVSNVWSEPQQVFFVFGTSTKNLQDNVAENAKTIRNTIVKSDLEVYKKIAYINGSNQKLKEQWLEFQGVSLDIPTDYKLAENEDNFVLLRKEIKKGMIFLSVDFINYSDNVPDANYGIKLRDERGKYVSSNSYNSYTKTDSTLGFLETKKIKGDLTIYETNGLWRMENDFMGGPFINQYIIDHKNNRVIYLDGFIYAPGENNKKKYMRQIEAIFNSLKVK